MGRIKGPPNPYHFDSDHDYYEALEIYEDEVLCNDDFDEDDYYEEAYEHPCSA